MPDWIQTSSSASIGSAFRHAYNRATARAAECIHADPDTPGICDTSITNPNLNKPLPGLFDHEKMATGDCRSDIGFGVFGGYICGVLSSRQQITASALKQFNLAIAETSLGRYVGYKSIATNIKSERYDAALCFAELGASAMYDDLKAYLADQSCGPALENRVLEIAPEISGEGSLEFKYRGVEAGIRACK